MTTANSASYLSEMAVAEEATPGVAATTPDIYDCFTDDPGIVPVQNVIRDGCVHSRSNKKHVLSNYHMDGSLPQMVEPEGMIGWWLKWALGGLSSAQEGATTAYKHTYTPAEELKSFTLWLLKGGNQQVKIPYGTVLGLELSQGLDDVLRSTIRTAGQKDEIATDFGSSDYSLLDPFHNTMLAVSIAGSLTGQAAQVHNTVISIDNGINLDDGRTHGSRFYEAVVPGKLNVSGSNDIWFDDDIEYQRFWGDAAATSPASTSTPVPLIFTWDTGIEAGTGYNYQLVITIPAAIYESTTVNLGGNRVVQHIDWYAELDPVTSREIMIELTNTKTGYT
jgi:Phage tail tube protein